MTWKPIETYPLRPEGYGENVLLVDKLRQIYIGKGMTISTGPLELIFFDSEGFEVEPTHWMELPDPP